MHVHADIQLDLMSQQPLNAQCWLEEIPSLTLISFQIIDLSTHARTHECTHARTHTHTYMLTLLAHDGVGKFTHKDAVHKVHLYTFLSVCWRRKISIRYQATCVNHNIII